MRKIFLNVGCLFISSCLSAQVSTVGMRAEFSQMSKRGRLQGAESLQSYSSGNVKGSRYYFAEWSKGSITSIMGDVYADPFLFLYDKQSQDVYFTIKDSNMILLANKSQVDNFRINDHLFVSGSRVNGADERNFYEWLCGKKEGYILYKLTTTKLMRFNKSDLERIKNGDFEDEYKDDISFFISYKNGPLNKISISEKRLSRLLPDAKQKIEAWFNSHSTENQDDHFVCGLIDYLNQ